MPRVLFLTWSESQPSTRYRVHQYLKGLERNGFDTEVFPAGGLTLSRRIKLLRHARAADVVYIQKKLFDPAFLPVLAAANPNIVFDFDDAGFAREPYNARPRGMAPGSACAVRRLKAVLKRARAVVAGNSYLASFAEAHNRAVHVLPTPVDTDRLTVSAGRASAGRGDRPGDPHGPPTATSNEARPRVRSGAKVASPEAPDATDARSVSLRIGWLGTSKNLYYLRTIAPALRMVREELDFVELSVLSNAPFEMDGIPVRNVLWSEEIEPAWLASIDVGIMPLEHDDWSRGKCAFKLLQYMAAGLPTVSTPVGMNAEVIEDSANGMLADSEKEWTEKLLALLGDPCLRMEMGAWGRRTVEERYSLRVCLEVLQGILRSVVD